MPRNGLPPHCSWEIDRHGKRRVRFRWRKVSPLHHPHAGRGKRIGAATTKLPSGATLGARSKNAALEAKNAALEAKNAALENRIEKLENLLALNTRFNELERNLAISMHGRRGVMRRGAARRPSPVRAALVANVEQLQSQLAQERAQHRFDVGELKRQIAVLLHDLAAAKDTRDAPAAPSPSARVH
jgi:cell division protein FtsB